MMNVRSFDVHRKEKVTTLVNAVGDRSGNEKGYEKAQRGKEQPLPSSVSEMPFVCFANTRGNRFI